MKQRPRIHYTETDKAMMWDRWQNVKTSREGLWQVTPFDLLLIYWADHLPQ